MSNVPRHGRTRASHAIGVRPSHGDSGYLSALVGSDELYKQTVVDGVYGEQNIIPGSVGSGQIRDGALILSKFTSDLRPPAIVGVLPILPDVLYPIGSLAVLATDGKLYRNVAGAWSRAVDGVDLVADSVTAGAIIAGAIGVSELAAGAVTADAIAVGAVTADAIAAGTIRVTEMAGDPKNLVPNPGAESAANGASSLSGWGSFGAQLTIRNNAALMRSGTACFQFVLTGTAAVSAGATFPVQGNRRYNVSTWVSGYSGNVAGDVAPQVIVQWKDSTGTLIAQVVAGSHAALGSSAVYYRIGSTLLSPADAVTATYILYVGGTLASGDRCYFDDCEMTLVDQDVDHAGGDVVIDSSGVTITNGKLMVTNAGSTVIIDGTSDMFKIGAVGTLSTSGAAGAHGTARNSATIVVGGTALPASMVWLEFLDTTPTPDQNAGTQVPSFVIDRPTGIVHFMYEGFVERTPTAGTFAVVVQTQATDPSVGGVDATYAYYLLLETTF